jgi:hypothetical protein
MSPKPVMPTIAGIHDFASTGCRLIFTSWMLASAGTMVPHHAAPRRQAVVIL